jgi:CheY-like chemotaxis protein
VLVVDDESIVADTVADVLNRNGYQAVAAYGGKQALRTANALCPDIVLCDVVMPELNGLEAAKALQRTCPWARIILFSGQAGSSQLLQFARAEGHQFEVLAKPIHPRELLRKLSPKQ